MNSADIYYYGCESVEDEVNEECEELMEQATRLERKTIEALDDKQRELFTEYAMMSPIEYITFLRIRYAKLLLQSEPLSIAQIAELVGYKDSGYFSKKFKAVTGQSPSDYQKYSKK